MERCLCESEGRSRRAAPATPLRGDRRPRARRARRAPWTTRSERSRRRARRAPARRARPRGGTARRVGVPSRTRCFRSWWTPASTPWQRSLRATRSKVSCTAAGCLASSSAATRSLAARSWRRCSRPSWAPRSISDVSSRRSDSRRSFGIRTSFRSWSRAKRLAACTTRCRSSKANRCATVSGAMARCPSRSRSASRPRSPTRSRTRTASASSTATSSQGTYSSTPVTPS